MAVEARRRCGHRKVGGKYLVAGKLGMPCCKMPIVIEKCPCCDAGIKQSRGWTWIDPRPFLTGECTSDVVRSIKDLNGIFYCPAADPAAMGAKVGLLWVGEKFYPTPGDFIAECDELGLSKRIKSIPHGFKVGESWVFLAHPKVKWIVDAEKSTEGNPVYKWVPGIFRIFKPTAVEQIITQSQSEDAEFMAKLAKQNITPVIVPDNDPDHQGSVYDTKQEEMELEDVAL